MTGGNQRLISRIVLSVAPPPEIEKPPLWGRDIAALSRLSWPPVRTA